MLFSSFFTSESAGLFVTISSMENKYNFLFSELLYEIWSITHLLAKRFLDFSFNEFAKFSFFNVSFDSEMLFCMQIVEIFTFVLFMLFSLFFSSPISFCKSIFKKSLSVITRFSPVYSCKFLVCLIVGTFVSSFSILLINLFVIS